MRMQKMAIEIGEKKFTYLKLLVQFVRMLGAKASIHTTGPMLLVKRTVAFMGL